MKSPTGSSSKLAPPTPTSSSPATKVPTSPAIQQPASKVATPAEASPTQATKIAAPADPSPSPSPLQPSKLAPPAEPSPAQPTPSPTQPPSPKATAQEATPAQEMPKPNLQPKTAGGTPGAPSPQEKLLAQRLLQTEAQYKRVLLEKEEEVKSLKEKGQQMGKALIQLQEKNAKLTQELTAANGSRDELQEELSKRAKTYAAMQKQVEQARMAKEAAEAAVAGELTSGQDLVKDMQDKLAAANARLSELEYACCHLTFSEKLRLSYRPPQPS